MLVAWRRAMTGWMATAVLVTGLVAGCTNSQSQPERPVSVAVQPGSSLADQAVRVDISGLGAGELVNVQLSSTDAGGVPWQSSAVYRADAGGDVDLGTAAAISGSYHGVSDMGLIWSMHALRPDPAGAYLWNNQRPLTFKLAVSAHGTQLASARFTRAFSPIPLTEAMQSLRADGFVGQFWRPASTAARRPAVLVLGGSEGGLPGTLLPALLASNGYPALGVAYFGEPGLPPALSRIPLEYFAGALRWLARQPGVDPARIAVLGVSRGSEAAQLLGVYYPGLVHAVIASVPSNVAICSYPRCTGPAWTLHGQPLPYTSEFDNPSPTDAPAAVIPDQRIQGPVFLDCGEADQTWSSCPYVQAIIGLLDAHHDRWAHVLYAYPGAGHPVGDLVPYEPASPVADPDYATDQQARALLWPRLLGFLAALAQNPAS
ncbi:MAG TPA: acyl-CoA thioesterase/bile acid-CoA:amino acid N-acyltransferase family protein [Trebonia sp.]|nr:acyl-CoA thioesterase/bile acid-CoA:amino acid N-acyltransferase family protein [Trebonia sp.]